MICQAFVEAIMNRLMRMKCNWSWKGRFCVGLLGIISWFHVELQKVSLHSTSLHQVYTDSLKLDWTHHFLIFFFGNSTKICLQASSLNYGWPESKFFSGAQACRGPSKLSCQLLVCYFSVVCGWGCILHGFRDICCSLDWNPLLLGEESSILHFSNFSWILADDQYHFPFHHGCPCIAWTSSMCEFLFLVIDHPCLVKRKLTCQQ